MAFNGKWRAVEVNDASAFLDLVHATEEYKQQISQLRDVLKSHPGIYTEEIQLNKATGIIKRLALMNGERVKDSAEVKVGVDVDGYIADGRPAKVKYTVESDNKFVLHEKSDSFDIKCAFEVSGNHMTATAVPTGHKAAFIAKFERV